MDFKVKSGDSLTDIQIYGYILPDKAKDCIKWEMKLTDGYLYDVGHKVIIATDTKEGLKIVSTREDATVYKKELTEKKDKWYFYAMLNKDIKLSSTSLPKITLVQSSQSYKMRVPLSCVVRIENGLYAVHALNKRQGLFSEEIVVNEITGKRYIMPISYLTSSLMTSEERLTEDSVQLDKLLIFDGFSEQMKLFAEKVKDEPEKNLFRYLGKKFKYYFLHSDLRFLDYENQKVAIDTPEFKTVMETCKELN